MDLATFAANYHQEVLAKCAGSEDGQMREEAFTELVLEDLAEANETGDAEICYFRSPGRRGTPATKLNACSFSGDGATLDVFVCAYSGTGQPDRLAASEVTDHFRLLRAFLERAVHGFYTELEESQEAFGVAHRIYQQRSILGGIRLFLITDSVVSVERITHPPDERVAGLDTKYFLWDIAKLHQFQTSGRQQEVITLSFQDDLGGAIECIGAEDASGEYWTYLAFLAGPLLARVYGEHGPRLLERNVRSFLQVRGKVNKGIQETIADAPPRFLAYNNGLAATAREVVVDALGAGRYLLRKAIDFQIVNGGQTTASLYHAWKKEHADISQVVVQLKLTVANEPSLLADFVPLISRYANSQNKVNTADFSANGPFHQALQAMSRTTWAPATGGMDRGTRWYYERARGSYLDDKVRAGTPALVALWERLHPLAQKFTKTDLAKFENTWDELPHFVSRGAEKNFAEWTQRREESGWPKVDEGYFRHLVAKAILFRSAERIIGAQGLPGYRANIVTYSLAWLVSRSSRRLPLEKIWSSQALSPALAEVIGIVGAEVRRQIMTPPGGMNITEWCKKEQCWTHLRKIEIELPLTWETELVADGYQKGPETMGDSEADAAIARLRLLPAPFWFELAKWAKERGHLKPWQRSLAYSLGKLAAEDRAPSAKQAAQGVKILDKVQDLGFAPS